MTTTTLEQNDTIKIGIIGLGYVGLPLAIEFSKKFGLPVIVAINHFVADSVNEIKILQEECI